MATVSTAALNGRAPALIRTTALTRRYTSLEFLKFLSAGMLSFGIHIVIFLIFLVVILTAPTVDASAVSNLDNDGNVDDPPEQKADLTESEVGTVSGVKSGYDVPLIAEVNVPGKVDPDGAIGIVGAPEAPM